MPGRRRALAAGIFLFFLPALRAFEYNGVCYDANWEDRSAWYGTPLSEQRMKHLKEIGVNTLSYSPFAHQQDVNEPEITFRPDADAAMEKDMETAKRLGFHIILKPHIWSREFGNGSGNWQGTIEMRSEEDWNRWFDSYEKMICHFAALAERRRVDVFVVGVEYERATRGRARAWKKIINSVRALYRGSLTYAAHNMVEADQIKFWDALDLIGVNAYFPLSHSNSPPLGELEKSWSSYRTMLGVLSSRNANKRLLLTEVGYSSVDGTAQKPYQWFAANSLTNLLEQADCYEAMFHILEGAPWLQGICIWKYKISVTPPEKSREPSEAHFVFQDKPAEVVIKTYFLKQ